MKKHLFAFLLSLMVPMLSAAQENKDSYEAGKVYFRLGETTIDPHYKGNAETLRKFADELNAYRKQNGAQVGQLKVVASASPDGRLEANERVVRMRAQAIADWVRKDVEGQLQHTVVFQAINWDLLIQMVEADPKVPHRDEVLQVLRNEPETTQRGDFVYRNRYNKLLQVHDGESLSYLYRNHFPELRFATVMIDVWQDAQPKPEAPAVVPEAPAVPEEPAVEEQPVVEKKPFYMAVKTNLLYDIAIIPNIGAEFYLGNNWSVAGNWQYIWLSNKADHKYWRVGAGDVALRKWFGRKADEKPLTGHHLGVYGQAITYDFAPTGKSGTIAEDYNWSVGVEYGYSLPIARRLNLDFTLGVGYHWGEYKKYEPIDDHSVWQATKQRNYFGPTKAEVSLVWLLGRGNYNKGKGGNR